MSILFGLSASHGIGIGKAFVIPEPAKREIPHYSILPGDRKNQLKKFDSSLATVTTKIAIQMEAVKNDKIQKEIFETYFLMLNDPEFLKEVRTAFEKSDTNIEYVLNQKTEEYAERLRSSGNEYLSERAQDICDIFGKVINDMIDYFPFDMETVPDDVVIVAKTLSPSDTLVLSKRKILGLALTEGGVSSHVGILARNFGIPAVVGIEKVIEEIKNGETVIVDGIVGEVLSSPDEETLVDYEKKIAVEKENAQRLAKFRDKEAVTKDGIKFQLLANIGTTEEAKLVLEEGADGIGLFRTEFLFMENVNKDISVTHNYISSFSEESQFNSYKSVLEAMKGKPVTIRTLDAGGDKIIKSAELKVGEEKNPLLGLRAIRLSLANPGQLKTQFRALFRAGLYGNLKIMLPLITGEDQFDKALEIAEKAKDELRSENIPFAENVPIGIMIETAAASIMADSLAKKAAFFSLGTNDLTQYTIGVDRENPAVANLYDEHHPAVIRLIKMTVDAANSAGIPVSVCGEMASRTESVLLLAKLGIRNLSMSAKKISEVKEFLSNKTSSNFS